MCQEKHWYECKARSRLWANLLTTLPFLAWQSRWQHGHDVNNGNAWSYGTRDKSRCYAGGEGDPRLQAVDVD